MNIPFDIPFDLERAKKGDAKNVQDYPARQYGDGISKTGKVAKNRAELLVPVF